MSSSQSVSVAGASVGTVSEQVVGEPDVLEIVCSLFTYTTMY